MRLEDFKNNDVREVEQNHSFEKTVQDTADHQDHKKRLDDFTSKDLHGVSKNGEGDNIESKKAIYEQSDISNVKKSDHQVHGEKLESAKILSTENSDVLSEFGDAHIKLKEYMVKHDYVLEDFDTYTQDPEWRALQKEAFPDTELPPLSPENAYAQLSEYMYRNNYAKEDFDVYSKDPEWRELQKAAFPDYELPPVGSKEYCSIVNALRDVNVEYRPIETVNEVKSTSDIITRLGGGDMTEGSCSSLAFAYAGNKAGYEVLDFRGGESRDYFSYNDSIEKIANLPGVNAKIIYGTDDIYCSNQLLQSMEVGREYYFATGMHASIVRNMDGRYEYLELQDSKENGWEILNNKALTKRFGCDTKNAVELPNFLIDVESLGKCKEFIDILGYINTAENNQMKGVNGYVR